jgi:hypothetical protein
MAISEACRHMLHSLFLLLFLLEESPNIYLRALIYHMWNVIAFFSYSIWLSIIFNDAVGVQ